MPRITVLRMFAPFMERSPANPTTSLGRVGQPSRVGRAGRDPPYSATRCGTGAAEPLWKFSRRADTRRDPPSRVSRSAHGPLSGAEELAMRVPLARFLLAV